MCKHFILHVKDEKPNPLKICSLPFCSPFPTILLIASYFKFYYLN